MYLFHWCSGNRFSTWSCWPCFTTCPCWATACWASSCWFQGLGFHAWTAAFASGFGGNCTVLVEKHWWRDIVRAEPWYPLTALYIVHISLSCSQTGNSWWRTSCCYPGSCWWQTSTRQELRIYQCLPSPSTFRCSLLKIQTFNPSYNSELASYPRPMPAMLHLRNKRPGRSSFHYVSNLKVYMWGHYLLRSRRTSSEKPQKPGFAGWWPTIQARKHWMFRIGWSSNGRIGTRTLWQLCSSMPTGTRTHQNLVWLWHQNYLRSCWAGMFRHDSTVGRIHQPARDRDQEEEQAERLVGHAMGLRERDERRPEVDSVPLQSNSIFANCVFTYSANSWVLFLDRFVESQNQSATLLRNRIQGAKRACEAKRETHVRSIGTRSTCFFKQWHKVFITRKYYSSVLEFQIARTSQESWWRGRTNTTTLKSIMSHSVRRDKGRKRGARKKFAERLAK